MTLFTQVIRYPTEGIEQKWKELEKFVKGNEMADILSEEEIRRLKRKIGEEMSTEEGEDAAVV